MRAGDRVWAGLGWSTILPTLDFETYSEAGYEWDSIKCKWRSLLGLGDQNRGLPAVGARNYVCHPSFRPLSLSWDLRDADGLQLWRPIEDFHTPDALLGHVAMGGLLEAWNTGFEWTVWNFYCVPKLGWPVLRLDQMRCAMAKARHFGLPGKLENAGDVMNKFRTPLTAPEIAAMCERKPERVWTPGAVPPGGEAYDDDIPF